VEYLQWDNLLSRYGHDWGQNVFSYARISIDEWRCEADTAGKRAGKTSGPCGIKSLKVSVGSTDQKTGTAQNTLDLSPEFAYLLPQGRDDFSRYEETCA
jgi:hypothetical protein